MDEEFRKEFLNNPVEIAKSFNLSETELQELKAIDFSELTAIDNLLEERISKSFINLPQFGDDGDYYSNHVSHGSHDNDSTHNNSGGAW